MLSRDLRHRQSRIVSADNSRVALCVQDISLSVIGDFAVPDDPRGKLAGDRNEKTGVPKKINCCIQKALDLTTSNR
jgi:hypothetical protein